MKTFPIEFNWDTISLTSMIVSRIKPIAVGASFLEFPAQICVGVLTHLMSSIGFLPLM